MRVEVIVKINYKLITEQTLYNSYSLKYNNNNYGIGFNDNL